LNINDIGFTHTLVCVSEGNALTIDIALTALLRGLARFVCASHSSIPTTCIRQAFFHAVFVTLVAKTTRASHWVVAHEIGVGTTLSLIPDTVSVIAFHFINIHALGAGETTSRNFRTTAIDIWILTIRSRIPNAEDIDAKFLIEHLALAIYATSTQVRVHTITTEIWIIAIVSRTPYTTVCMTCCKGCIDASRVQTTGTCIRSTSTREARIATHHTRIPDTVIGVTFHFEFINALTIRQAACRYIGSITATKCWILAICARIPDTVIGQTFGHSIFETLTINAARSICLRWTHESRI